MRQVHLHSHSHSSARRKEREPWKKKEQPRESVNRVELKSVSDGTTTGQTEKTIFIRDREWLTHTLQEKIRWDETRQAEASRGSMDTTREWKKKKSLRMSEVQMLPQQIRPSQLRPLFNYDERLDKWSVHAFSQLSLSPSLLSANGRQVNLLYMHQPMKWKTEYTFDWCCLPLPSVKRVCLKCVSQRILYICCCCSNIHCFCSSNKHWFHWRQLFIHLFFFFPPLWVVFCSFSGKWWWGAWGHLWKNKADECVRRRRESERERE